MERIVSSFAGAGVDIELKVVGSASKDVEERVRASAPHARVIDMASRVAEAHVVVGKAGSPPRRRSPRVVR